MLAGDVLPRPYVLKPLNEGSSVGVHIVREGDNANPPDNSAWKLIDEAGCRGLTIGGAQVSEKHCNFLLNLGDATAADIETLGEEVRARVHAKSGIELRWEIRRIGEAS